MNPTPPPQTLHPRKAISGGYLKRYNIPPPYETPIFQKLADSTQSDGCAVIWLFCPPPPVKRPYINMIKKHGFPMPSRWCWPWPCEDSFLEPDLFLLTLQYMVWPGWGATYTSGLELTRGHHALKQKYPPPP